jgi:DNA-binding LytR/AlgR family response regulator
VLTLDQIKERLKDSNLRAVSQSAGVNYHTLVKLMREEGRDPAYSTVKALSDYLNNWK